MSSSQDKFDYCSTCGIAENPECNTCGETFWHRAMGATLNGGNGSGKTNHLCPSCSKKEMYKKAMSKND